MRRDESLPDLSGQRVLVTGASGGIGRGIAGRFAAAGAHVALHYRGSAERVFAAVEEIRDHGGAAVAVRADLSEPGAAEALVVRAAEALGGLDGLVNNAGIQTLAPLDELSRSAWDEMLATNLGAVFELSQAAARVMRASGAAGGGEGAGRVGGAGGSAGEAGARAGAEGRWITHIASIEASRPVPAHAHYAAAKAAVVMHARAAALELGPAGIRVNTVSPGLVDRPGLAADWPEGVASWLRRAPLGRLCTAEDVGDVCVLLASPAASFVTGQDIAVDGGMLATPGW